MSLSPSLRSQPPTDSVIQSLVDNIINLPPGNPLDDLLVDARESEAILRYLFASEPHHYLLADPYAGLINVFNTRSEVWKVIGRPREANNEKYILPLDNSLRRPWGSPSIVSCYPQFRSNWALFTHNVLSGINWENVVAAGGSVLACLMPTPPSCSSPKLINKYYQSTYAESDIDLFLYGLTATEAEGKMCQIYEAICATVDWDVICVRKANVISIHTSYPFRPIQIILRLYRSPAEILAGFDVDAACCAYDGQYVWTSWRSLAACIRQTNTIDMSRRSPSYEIRLAKYASRGFEVYYPALSRERIDPSIFETMSPNSRNGLARLLILERRYTGFFSSTGRRYPWWRQLLLRESVRVGPGRRFKVNLETNNYDVRWTIPYGPTWSAARILRKVQEIYVHINDPMVRGRYLHRHAIYAGSMYQCIEDFCPACPLPINDDERLIVESESGKYIRGRVQFVDFNAGRQTMTGSFRPIDAGTWEEEAYTPDATVVPSVAGVQTARPIDAGTWEERAYTPDAAVVSSSGSQTMTWSFRPIDAGTWEEQTYTSDATVFPAAAVTRFGMLKRAGLAKLRALGNLLSF